MSRDKQIEEMAKDLYTCHDEYVRDGDGWVTDYNSTAKRLYDKGYRKASEVAREILTDKILIDHLERACGAGGKLALARIKELKKVYGVK